MIAAGIDLGGTKIEGQLFDADWSLVDRRRVETPRDYPALVEALAEMVRWARAAGGADLPVGISAAGLINPATGIALTANLAAMGKPFAADLATTLGGPVPFVNDCRALTLSEARFGAGQGATRVAGLILGTGVGGGFARDGRLEVGPSALGGEYGHLAAPAALIARHGLPIFGCGCGRQGCFESYVSGPGMSRITKALTGRELSSKEIAAERATDPEVARAFEVWLDFLAELLVALSFTIDPEVVVLGGGVSQIDGLLDALDAAVERALYDDYTRPRLAVAQGGDASGARGAAYAALQEAEQNG